MKRLCQYKDIFGAPRTGVHAYRFLDFAIVDILFTLLGAWLIHKYSGYNLWKTVIVLILFGIFMHWLFCVETKLNVILGLI